MSVEDPTREEIETAAQQASSDASRQWRSGYKSRAIPRWVALNLDPERFDMHVFFTWRQAQDYADLKSRQPAISRFGTFWLGAA